MVKLTLLSHIFNEEYLLPFWLNHHKNMFDHGIIVDYRSTDNSISIINKICPTWEIITSRNIFFIAHEIDKEMMELEEKIDGFKIILNTTEFLTVSSNIPIKNLLQENIQENIELPVFGAFSTKLDFYPKTVRELFESIEIVNYKIRGFRFLHSYSNGSYSIGRHGSSLPSKKIEQLSVTWFGFHPYNEKLIKRKIQIGANMIDSDIAAGLGTHHRWNEVQMYNYMLSVRNAGLNVNTYDYYLDVVKNITNDELIY